MQVNVDQLDPRHHIIIKGARANNLKGVDVAIPRNQFVVITGLSGSGKSSLAFDTLFAEGQRMYVESLSSYARQFLGRMEKPAVEYIKGVSPAIAVEQKSNTKNPRATVGTSTEIYDYLKLLFARIGVTYSPVSGNKVKKDSVTDVVNYIQSHSEGQKLLITAPVNVASERSLEDELKLVFQKGFTRLLVDGDTLFIEELLEDVAAIKALKGQEVFILVDRNVVKKDDEDNQFRIADSVQTAFYEGQGSCMIHVLKKEVKEFSDRFELDGIKFEEPTVQFFSFNNPYGACKRCGGFGSVLDIDEDLVIPNKNLSVYDNAIVPWSTEKMRKEWFQPLIQNSIQFDFPIHRSYRELSKEQKQLLWEGNEHFQGLNAFFEHIASQSHKIQYRVMLSRYRGKITCPDCQGTRLRKDASYVKIAEYNINDMVLMPLEDLRELFLNLSLKPNEQQIARRVLTEINNRIKYLNEVGLGYLTLNRLTSTLSGGEYQRIKLATALGSALVGSMYILDEPSIGLHPRDTHRLIGVLKDLKALGNTVIVVEHEEDIMRHADQIIDIGPDAGTGGGELIFQGTLDAPIQNGKNSHTLNFLNGTDSIAMPKVRRKANAFITLVGAEENNLKNVEARFPLGVMTVVTGVSGSGKSTLIKDILYPALAKMYGDYSSTKGKYQSLEGDTQALKGIEFIDQNPIGKSSRSNPVTYTKSYDTIRNLFANTALAKKRGYKPAHFSFNVDKGRCEVCEGEGKVKIEMQFMADVYLTCESCKGKRFKKEILDIKYNDKDIAEILDLTVEESLDFFKNEPKIVQALSPLYEVGLGYVGLGQSSNTLSGGEAQRLKLASFLDKRNARKGNTLFIFDEPTTGLHFNDIKKLLKALNALVEQGHSVLVIEHNLEVIKSADWIIDLGPEGGAKGGQICFQGIPEDLIGLENNHTARFLKEKF
ncbi:excinuclease ABC subunit UvrA [Microscilla marina]|uniref:UvrABC system protein A n=1 Tax=Microscilla marina ATCC 23134 TaxID=313606 RepID=A1ZF30_MICM2|nr:excinuclease ABC subunit UvrA [Microscilla marina]EAY31132.1 excinuclease ABC, A subunit [Microscilla marina ATCC 23134]